MEEPSPGPSSQGENQRQGALGYRALWRALLPVVLPVWVIVVVTAGMYRIHDEAVEAWVREKVYGWLSR